MPSTASFLVELNGSPLPDDVAALLMAGYVDCSLRLPDAFMLRFRDPGRIVIEKSGVAIGSKLKISVTTDESQTPEKLIAAEVTSLEAEVDTTGSFTTIRGYDPAHRLFSGRHTVSYTQATASDAATKVAQRAGIGAGTVEPSGTVFDHLGQCGQTDWEFLDGIAKPYRVRAHRAGQQTRLRPPQTRADRTHRRQPCQHESACAEAGFGYLAVPVGGHLRRTGRQR